MKFKSLSALTSFVGPRKSILTFAVAVSSLVASQSAHAVAYFWDVNGTTPGFGTITGAWNTGLFWNTDNTGGAGTLIADPTSADVLSVIGGTTGTITLTGTKTASSLTVNPATPVNVTITGGTLALGGTGASIGLFAGAAQTAATNVSSPITINNGNNSIQNTGSGVMNVSGGITGPSNLIVRNNGITLAGITLSGAAGINTSGTISNTGTGTGGTLISTSIGSTVTNVIQNGASTLTLTGTANAQALTTVTSGILSLGTTGALGGVTQFSTNGAYSVGNNGSLVVYNAVSDSDIAAMLGTTNFLAGSSFGFDTTTASRTYSEVIANTAQGSLGLTKNGGNTLTLSDANTFTGITRIRQGTVSVGSLNSVNAGAPLLATSALGAPTTVATGTIAMGGTPVATGLTYTGTGETTDRVIQLISNTNNTFTQAGTGLLKFTSNFAFSGSNNRTVTLSGSTEGSGEIAGIIPNSTATLYTSITKTGTGKWTLSAANTFGNPGGSGVTINGGTLALGAIGANGGKLTTGVTVNTGATFAVTPGISTSSSNNSITSTATALTMNSGSNFTMADGFTNALTLTGAVNLYAGAAVIAPTYNFNLNSTSPSGGPGAPGAADVMQISGAATFTNPGAQLFFTALNELQVGDTFTVATAGSGLDSPNAWSLGSTQAIFGDTAYSLSLTNTATSSVITVTGSSPVGAAAYYTGDQGTTLNANNSGNTNWSSTLDGSTDSTTQPTGLTDVVFTATNATNLTIAALGQDFSFKSLNFNNTTASVTLNDSGSNSITLGAGITMNADVLPATVTAPIVLGASQTWTNSSFSGGLTVGNTISGNAGLTKAGSGVVTLSGSNPNTFTGPLNVSEGILAFNKTPGVAAVAGPITVGNGLGGSLDILQLDAADQIPDSTLVTLNGLTTVLTDTGVFRLNGHNETVAGLDSLAGTGIVENGAATESTLTLNPTANRTFRGTLQDGGGGGVLNLIKTGSFTQNLAGGALVNAITGLTTVSGGTLVLNKTAGVNALSGNVVIGDGSTTPGIDILALTTTGNQIIDTAVLTFNGSGTDAGTFRLTGMSETVNHLVSATSGAGVIENDHLSTASTLSLNDTTDSEFSGIIQNSSVVTNLGTLSLSKIGFSTLTLSGANTYTGATSVSQGTLKVGNAGVFTNKGTLGLTASGTFDLNGHNAAFTNVTGNVLGPVITNTGSTDATLIVSALGTQLSATLTDGPTNKLAIQISNANSGTNLFRLDGLNTFSGGITLTGTNTRLRVDSVTPGGQTATTITNAGNPGAIINSPFGRGPITLGLASIGDTDKAGMMFSNLTGTNVVLNEIIFNTALGTDVKGIRTDSSALNLSFAGKITANLANATFTGNGGSTLTGQVTGNFGLETNIAAVSLTLANTDNPANDYKGETLVGATSSLILGASDQIPNGATFGNLTANGTFNLAGFNETINGLNGAATGVVNNLNGASILTLGANDATASFAGALRNTGGSLDIVKIGAGTQTFTGQNTSTGNILASAGTLDLADNAKFTFVTGSTSGSGNNTLTGAGTVTLNGDFAIDTTASDTAGLADGSWQLENVASLTGSYGSTFSVVGWADIGNDKWTKVSNGKKYTFDETTGTVTLAADAYASWIDGFFPGSTDLAIIGPDADPDNDGVKNILEYALNGKPNDGSSLGIQKTVIGDSSTPSGNDLTLVIAVLDGTTFAPGAGGSQTAAVQGVSYAIQGSTDLSTFANSVSQVGSATNTAADLPDLTGTAWEYKTFKLNSSEGLGGLGFLRVQVTAQ
jgi:fibronectin-binding autotransporter adhesin